MIECLAVALLALLVQSEAPQEPFDGQVAVAYVAMNRTTMVHKDVVEVIQQPKQFALNPRVHITEAAWAAAKTAYYRLQADPTNGADHFYNPLVKPWPSWYDERYTTARIGNHVFLRLGGF